MRVDHISRHTDASGGIELSADIDGFRLWYRFPPGCAAYPRGDVFACAALLPAMRANENLAIVDAPVSPRLLAGIDRLQDVFHVWNPAFRRIRIEADLEPAPPAVAGTASFFSGGVDGCFTFLKHAEEIGALVFIKGVDIQVDNDVLFDQALAANRAFAAAYGKTLLPVATNIRRFLHPRQAGWSISAGGGLASVAHALGWSRMYVAASHTYAELHPLGTHPMLDHLWSSEAVELVHDGAEARRSDKLRRIAESKYALENLRVCWHDSGYNCGRCEKCLRTRIALHLLGLSTPTLAPLDSLAPVRAMRVEDDDALPHFMDNHRLAEETGHAELAGIIGAQVRNYRLRRLLVDIDRQVAGGRLKQVWNAVRGRG